MRLKELAVWATELTQLRGTPADAPLSTVLLLQLLLLDLLFNLLYAELAGVEIGLGRFIGHTLLSAALIYLVMRAFGRACRFLQTLIALYAVSAVVTVVLFPIALALARSRGQEPDLGLQFLVLGYLIVRLWSIVIQAHILRHALGLKFWYALPLSFGLYILDTQMASLFWPSE